MSAAARLVFALCALQAYPWLTLCQRNEPLLNREENCNGNFPKVEIKSCKIGMADKILLKNKDIVSIEYDSRLTVTCAGAHATQLSMTKNGAKLQTEVLNETSITWSTTIKDRPTSEYVCTDTDTGCEFSIFVAVSPAFVTTLHNHEILAGEYILPYGNPISLLCSGPDANRLVITKDGQRVLTEKESETTIKWVGTPDLQESSYICTDDANTFSRREHITVEPAVNIKKSKYEPVIKEEYFDFYSLEHVYNFTYRDSVVICCSGPRPVTFSGFGNDNMEKFTYRNETTRKMYVLILQLGASSYSCFDLEFPDHRSKVRFEVTPRMEAISRNIRRVGNRYVMTYGDYLEINCSGPDAQQLDLFKEGSIITQEVEIVNRTTVQLLITKPAIHDNPLDYDAYVCAAGDVKARVMVTVE